MADVLKPKVQASGLVDIALLGISKRVTERMLTPIVGNANPQSGIVKLVGGSLIQGRGKIGAAVVAVRRAGAIHAFDSINHFFLISQMIVPGSSYWNIGIGRAIGDVEQDDEGLETMRILGKNMAWLLKKTQN